VEVDRISSILMPLAAAGDSARLRPWMAKLLVERGDLGRAHDLLDRPPLRWRVHAGTTLEARIDLMIAEQAWDDASSLLHDARSHAAKAELIALPPFCDRLEGYVALGSGDGTKAEASLGRAIEGFTGIGAVLERARTER